MKLITILYAKDNSCHKYQSLLGSAIRHEHFGDSK